MLLLLGDTAIFKCRVEGEPAPNVEWSKGKWSKLKNDNRTRIYKEEETGMFVMELDGIKKKDSGTYTVTISNEYGTESCPVTLMVTDKPEDVVDWKAQLKKA